MRNRSARGLAPAGVVRSAVVATLLLFAAGLVADAADVCTGDPALAARRYFADVATPEGRTVRIDGPPFVLTETPAAVRGPGPLLSEHADAVLAELGYDADAIAALRRDGVVV